MQHHQLRACRAPSPTRPSSTGSPACRRAAAVRVAVERAVDHHLERDLGVADPAHAVGEPRRARGGTGRAGARGRARRACARVGTRRFVMRISQWLPSPAIVSMSRTISQPGLSAGRRGTRELRACGGSASGSVLAMTIAKRAPLRAGDEPLVAVDHPVVAVLHGARLDAASGRSRRPRARSSRSTSATRPSASGRRYFSFCSGVAKCSSVCMLPSSGAWR